MNIPKNFIFCLGLSYIILNSHFAAAVMLNPDELIKVTGETNAKCVEYFQYKGELYCSTKAYGSEPVDPKLNQEEKLHIQFDNRPWQIGWGKIKPDYISIEYIPMGDNINNWNELITSQFFPDLQQKITPKKFAELFMQQYRESGYKPIVSYLLDTSDKVIVEYRIEEPKNQAQDELLMITQDDKGIYLLHYVIKKADMGQKNRDKWLKNLKDSTIKNDSLRVE